MIEENPQFHVIPRFLVTFTDWRIVIFIYVYVYKGFSAKLQKEQQQKRDGGIGKHTLKMGALSRK